MIGLISLCLFALDTILLMLWSVGISGGIDMNHIVGFAILAGILGVFDGLITRRI